MAVRLSPGPSTVRNDRSGFGVRQNVPTTTRRPLSTFGRRSPVQARAWAWPTMLVVLILLTSLAVASVSAWLVLPYLILMSLILLPTALRRDDATRDLGAGSGAGVAVAGLHEAGSLVAGPPSADPAALRHDGGRERG